MRRRWHPWVSRDGSARSASGPGTTRTEGQLLTSGGRVLCVVGLGDSVRLAQQRAYQGVQSIRFDGAQWRTDIGHRAIKAR